MGADPRKSGAVAVRELLTELSRRDGPGALRDVLASVLKDRSLSVGFWVEAEARYVDAAGRAVELDDLAEDRVVNHLTSHGKPLAVLVADASRAQDRELVEAVLGAAHAAVENERLHAELRAQLEEVRASRQRIVTAADRERRRIERDLHDGAQQRLLAVAMNLEFTRGQIGDGEPEIALALAEIQAELQRAVDDLRELARGIHPAILTDGGLVMAVRAIARRSPVPMRITGEPARRSPNAIEAAAYFVCLEALTNVVRHAHATRAAVDLRHSDEGRLVVRVTDDGRGGADPAGSGLRGLADRVAGLGGGLTVTGAAGEGTVVEAWLPDPEPA